MSNLTEPIKMSKEERWVWDQIFVEQTKYDQTGEEAAAAADEAILARRERMGPDGLSFEVKNILAWLEKQSRGFTLTMDNGVVMISLNGVIKGITTGEATKDQ